MKIKDSYLPQIPLELAILNLLDDKNDKESIAVSSGNKHVIKQKED